VSEILFALGWFILGFVIGGAIAGVLFIGNDDDIIE